MPFLLGVAVGSGRRTIQAWDEWGALRRRLLSRPFTLSHAFTVSKPYRAELRKTEAKGGKIAILVKVNYKAIAFIYFLHAEFAIGIVQVLRHEISPVHCRKFSCTSSYRRGARRTLQRSKNLAGLSAASEMRNCRQEEATENSKSYGICSGFFAGGGGRSTGQQI